MLLFIVWDLSLTLRWKYKILVIWIEDNNISSFSHYLFFLYLFKIKSYGPRTGVAKIKNERGTLNWLIQLTTTATNPKYKTGRGYLTQIEIEIIKEQVRGPGKEYENENIRNRPRKTKISSQTIHIYTQKSIETATTNNETGGINKW